jgi:hypothetical protein
MKGIGYFGKLKLRAEKQCQLEYLKFTPKPLSKSNPPTKATN